ncbi:recombinase family protein [Hymenobacter siberiensis]|uniref:recombinase family protein n=1 Tax=Hymenobacter siberiensis TaxID=2848396 RepID=UPI001C1E83AC|nr:recombinase family protein [Hymenobacter siberiensis]MBU6122596.1 recombinase family protein [Hymenobacter siberiensis]
MRVAIYARVSTRDKGQTTENQLPDLRRYAEVQGWSIYKEYSEEESGGTAKRSQFQQLFADAHQRRFDLVLFWSLDRFSREGALPTLQHLNQLEQWGVGYKSFTEQYLDSTGLFKDAIVSILATLGKQERVRLSERTKAGLARTRAKGTILGRRAIDPRVVEQIRNLGAQGKSERAIASALGVSKGAVGKYLKVEVAS